jgi:hypothetical protein
MIFQYLYTMYTGQINVISISISLSFLCLQPSNSFLLVLHKIGNMLLWTSDHYFLHLHMRENMWYFSFYLDHFEIHGTWDSRALSQKKLGQVFPSTLMDGVRVREHRPLLRRLKWSLVKAMGVRTHTCV